MAKSYARVIVRSRETIMIDWSEPLFGSLTVELSDAGLEKIIKKSLFGCKQYRCSQHDSVLTEAENGAPILTLLLILFIGTSIWWVTKNPEKMKPLIPNVYHQQLNQYR